MVVANDLLVSNVLVPEICTTQVSVGTDPNVHLSFRLSKAFYYSFSPAHSSARKRKL